MKKRSEENARKKSEGRATKKAMKIIADAAEKTTLGDIFRPGSTENTDGS